MSFSAILETTKIPVKVTSVMVFRVSTELFSFIHSLITK